MLRRQTCQGWIAGFAVLGVLQMGAPTAEAQSNIDSVNKWAWCENGGWINWFDNGVTSGAIVGSTVLQGFIWSENLGWIYLGDGTPAAPPYYSNAVAGDTGVNISPAGDLSGFAWAENFGWINFDTAAAAGPDRARLDPYCCGWDRFRGYAWGENVGWINLDTAFGFVGIAASAKRAKADLNGDGTRDSADIMGLIAAFLTPAAASSLEFCAADMNGDGLLTDADITMFVDCLLTGACVCP